MIYAFNDISINHRIILNSGSFSYGPGVLTAISGKSGSGKSTLMRKFKEEHEDEIYSHYSFCYQVPHFIETLTIQEHINLLGRLTNQKSDIDEYTEILNLTDLLDKYPNQLSGGEQKRVGLLLAVIKPADILVLDEPTASLNEEYASEYIKLFSKLKEQGKGLIIFTHDNVLIKNADQHYHIEDAELQFIDGNKSNNVPLKMKTPKNMKKIINYIKTAMYRGNLLLKVLPYMIPVIIAASCYCFNYGQVFSISQNNILKRMVTDEIQVFRPAPYSLYPLDFSYTNEYPLNEEDLNKISKIEHLSAVEWRYDMKAPCYGDEDITDETFDPYLSFGKNMNYSILKNDNEIIHKNLEDTDFTDSHVIFSTYLKSHIQESDINMKFGDEGIFISRELAEVFTKEMGANDISELDGCFLRIDMPVPLYNTFGRHLGASGDMVPVPTYSITVCHEEIVLPIAGVLKEASFGVVNYYSNVIYVERGIVEKLIEMYKPEIKERILYVTNEDWSEYMTEKPDDSVELNRIFEDHIWQPTSYSVFVDKVENIPLVCETLNEMGYSASCVYTQEVMISKNLDGAIKAYAVTGVLLALLGILFEVVLILIRRKQQINIRSYFDHLGLTKKEINHMFHQFIDTDQLRSFLISISYILGITLYFQLVKKMTFIPAGYSLMAIVLEFVVHFIILKFSIKD